MKIAILGAESTGKTQLAQALCKALTTLSTKPIWVPEVLRHWCDARGRTPLAHEQMAIATAQTAALEGFATTSVRISDTTALMTAVYSDLLFNDSTLYAYGLAQQRKFDITLVTGLDLAWVPDGLQRDGVRAQHATDDRLRQVLHANSVPYVTVYGSGNQRTQCALQAISHLESTAMQNDYVPAAWHWNCENCSDALCERRLFSQLLQTSASVQV